MKSLSKKVASIIVVLLLAAGVFLYLNFGDLAKRAAEKIATNALGVNVSISSLDVSLKEKKAVLTGLSIDNPPGYNKNHIITADRLNIGLNTASRELIDFKDVTVDGVVVNLEVNEKGTNLSDLKKLARKKEQRDAVGSKQVRLIVRQMVINTSTLNPSVTLLGRDIASVEIPAIRLSGLGTGSSNGAVAQDVVSQVIVQYLSAAERQARQKGMLSIGDGVIDDVKDTLDGAAKKLEGLFN